MESLQEDVERIVEADMPFPDSEDQSRVLANLLASSDRENSLESLDSISSLPVDYKSRPKHASDGSFLFNEFDLQDLPTESLPTLDSILSEKDEDIYNPDDLSSGFSGGTLSDDGTASVVSELVGTMSSVPDSTRPRRPNAHGSVLRHVVLKKISSQMIDACERSEAGLPTSAAVSNLIAIGTSHGVVLVFEPQDQVLKLVLGTTSDGEKFGAVTALGINVDCTRLLCGYARGQITMWDLSSGNCLRVILDAHPAGFAVLHIQFTDDPTVAMLNDSSGSVYTLAFRRVISRTCESSCFFSGSKGEVCTMSPLRMGPQFKDNPLYDCSLLAMASLTKLIVVSLKPVPTAIFTRKLIGPKDSLPVIGWHFAAVETSPGVRQVVPVLAFGRNATIYVYQVSKDDDAVQFVLLQTLSLNYALISMAWLNSQVIITIDTLERIRTIDVRSREELECLDISVVRLVYSSSYFKSLSTGGNVSAALKAASNYACYQSVQVFNGQLILLGTSSVHCVSLRTWKDRIDYFLRRNEFQDALELAKSFYTDKGKAVVGLAGNKQKRKALIAGEIVDILLAFLDISITVNCPKTSDETVLASYFRSLMPTSVDYCLLIDDLDTLFTEVYDRFVDDAVAKREFLESLEVYVLDGKVKSLSPVVMKDFVEHFETTHQLRKLEACLVHLDLAAVDLDYMVKLCWAHSLYDAVIYIYNKGLHDYLTPFESLVKLLKEALKKNNNRLSESDTALGCKILVYVSCCLAGNQYPIGEIESGLIREVKADIFNSLISKRSEHFSYDVTYPVVRTLLLFDTREFLNVLAIAFEESEFCPAQNATAVGVQSKRQRIVDVLLQVMVNDASFTPAQLGCLFTFIARQMAKHEGTIEVNKLLFEQVLEYLCNADEQSRHEEREQALLELLAAGGLRHFPDERILALAESAQFYRVCELIYQKKRQYDKVLSCYWRDPARKYQVYAYVDQLLSGESFTDLERDEIGAAIISCMDHLVEVDSRKFARMVIKHFPSTLVQVADKLQSAPDVQYLFLQGVFCPKSAEREKRTEAALKYGPELHEQFISLMCRFDPAAVLPYLESCDNYRLEQVFVIVESHQIVDAMAFVLERLGDIHGAFRLLCDDLKVKVSELDKSFPVGGNLDEGVTSILRTTRKSLNCVMLLCLRNSSKLESSDRDLLWFPLLEVVMAPQRRIKDAQSTHFLVFKEFTKEVLSNMMAYISLPSVLQKIMQDPTYSSGKFSEVKDLVLGMLDTYTYELTLLETTTTLLGRDLHRLYETEKKARSCGYSATNNKCPLCFQSFSPERSRSAYAVIVFRCNHAFHDHCLQGTVGFGEQPVCMVCNKANAATSVGRKRVKGRSDHGGGATSEGKSRANRKPELFRVDLSDMQQDALEALWSHERKPSRAAILGELNAFSDWASLSSARRSNSLTSPLVRSMGQSGIIRDERFALRLAPPSLR